MQKVTMTAAAIGVALLSAVGTAQAGCMLQASSSSATDQSAKQMATTVAGRSVEQLRTQYGAPLSTRTLSAALEQMTWSLAAGELQVLADSATGKILDAKLRSAGANSTYSTLSACDAGK